ncbi:MAG: hypothetical protein IJU16_04715 [Clostridia bacterium]|nr:hypothetical protein [Clostridia bacterium]
MNQQASLARKGLAYVLSLAAIMALFSGCSDIHRPAVFQNDAGETVEGAIPLSGFEDVTGFDKTCTYEMRADITDRYTFTCSKKTVAIEVTTADGTPLSEGENPASASLQAGETYRIKATSKESNEKIHVDAEADNHKVRLPYQNVFTIDPEEHQESDPAVDPLKPASISYQKREGGTYIYANNPEKLANEDVGQALMRDRNLTGSIEVTWEYSNASNKMFYLGYQLKNEGKTDVFVTVTNIGIQVQGEWLGQQSWSDYYNLHFDLPDDYFVKSTVVAEPYRGQDFIQYTPRVFQPTTYRIPAGEYIYVLGGTSEDAYNSTNVADTANKIIQRGKCTNAVAKFQVTGGVVTGTLYCYENADQVTEEPEEQGYVCKRGDTEYGLQYKGIDPYEGLIESNITWTVNDQTEAGYLPVTYPVSYSPTAARYTKPYKEYKNTQTEIFSKSFWITNINPQSNHSAVGTDMSAFTCRTVDGEEVTIDTFHADGTGNSANLGNWMIDYHDNYTIYNDGDTEREFLFRKYANGALMAMVLDPDGKVLATKCTIQPLEGSKTDANVLLYTLTVPPHSYRQITISFLLMGNSSGNVAHMVELV